MIRVGVTGGIGSGKTTFCKVWEELGAFVVYADDFAKELMTTDSELINNIKDVFGEASYFENGTLNRAYLANEAFVKGRVEELNEIVHPVLWKRIDELSDEKERLGIKIFLKEAALLLDKGRPINLDYVVLIKSETNERIERVIERDNTTKSLVLDRMSKQHKFEEIEHLADYLVDNNGSMDQLKQRAKTIYQEINKQM